MQCSTLQAEADSAVQDPLDIGTHIKEGSSLSCDGKSGGLPSDMRNIPEDINPDDPPCSIQMHHQWLCSLPQAKADGAMEEQALLEPLDINVHVKDGGMALLSTLTPDFRWQSGAADITLRCAARCVLGLSRTAHVEPVPCTKCVLDSRGYFLGSGLAKTLHTLFGRLGMVRNHGSKTLVLKAPDGHCHMGSQNWLCKLGDNPFVRE